MNLLRPAVFLFSFIIKTKSATIAFFSSPYFLLLDLSFSPFLFLRAQETCLLTPFHSNDSGAPNDNFRKNICSEDDLRSRIFGTFVVKFFACMPLLGFSNI